MLKSVIVFDHFGPYHLARLKALRNDNDVVAIQVRDSSLEYSWSRQFNNTQDNVCYNILSNEEKETQIKPRLFELLSNIDPDVVFVPGWSSVAALLCLDWCGTMKVPVIVMSDSQLIDVRRNPILEFVKRNLISHVAGAFVAGNPHKEYAKRLGISDQNIRLGYDVVDNDYFRQQASELYLNHQAYLERTELVNSFVLASSRFIPRKNIEFLIRSFHESQIYQENIHLVVLGDGPLRAKLEDITFDLNLQEFVHFPGFVQYSSLPQYYGRALGFVHCSTSEQWGLVVNEAMASNLPVFVSHRCGCALDLIRPGRNGDIFDPYDQSQLASLLREFASMSDAERLEMGRISGEIITNWSLKIFSDNFSDLARMAVGNGAGKYSVTGLLLNRMVYFLKSRHRNFF